MMAAAVGGGALGVYMHAGTTAHLPVTTPQPHYAAAATASPTSAIPTASFAGLPVRIQIPELKVDAAIDYVGLNAKGEMDVPAAALNAAWYKYGPLPGDPGSAVIDGHVLGLKGEPGVFQHLDKIRSNDQLRVLDGHGQEIVFIVRETRLYNSGDQPAEIFS